jgi:ankyrin repeat protein
MIRHYAASKNSFNVVELLLQACANVNCTDLNAQTPLHRAAARGNSKIAELLIQNGAKVTFYPFIVRLMQWIPAEILHCIWLVKIIRWTWPCC